MLTNIFIFQLLMQHRGLFNNCTSLTVAFASANGEHNVKKAAQINEPHVNFF